MDTFNTAFTMHRIGKFFFFIMLFIPLITLPIISYNQSNWWYLFGMVFVFIGGSLAIHKKRAGLFAFISFIIIGFWAGNGFNFKQYFTFFYCCALFGFFCALFGYGYQYEANKVYQEIKASDTNTNE